MRANERQVGGSHYKQEGGAEEHWDRVALLRLNYFEGQITKYVERCRKKNGIQDLEKARHFLDKYIELANEGKIEGLHPAKTSFVDHDFVRLAGLVDEKLVAADVCYQCGHRYMEHPDYKE